MPEMAARFSFCWAAQQSSSDSAGFCKRLYLLSANENDVINRMRGIENDK
jgi:hypothetical protein